LNEEIRRRFVDWTQGLNELDSRIRVFEKIKNIPYGVTPNLPPDYNITRASFESSLMGFFKYNRGTCTHKHYLLGSMFEKLGIPVKYATYPFYWRDLDVDFPKHVRYLAEQMPLAYHLACKVVIGSEELVVDATWDSTLAKAGFPVNREWDGFLSTSVAVKARSEILHNNLDERFTYVHGRLTKEPKIREFSDELDKWLRDLQEPD